MDRIPSNPNQPSRAERKLAQLKILSRLLGHELHAQTGPRLTLSRDEVQEIQALLDMFIEEQQPNTAGANVTPAELQVEAVPARVSRVN